VQCVVGECGGVQWVTVWGWWNPGRKGGACRCGWVGWGPEEAKVGMENMQKEWAVKVAGWSRLQSRSGAVV